MLRQESTAPTAGKGRWGAAAVLDQRVGERGLHVVPRALEAKKIDEVALLHPPDDGGQLVGDDLFRRIYTDAAEGRLLVNGLRRPVEHEIDDDGLFTTSEDRAPKTWGVLANLVLRAELDRQLGQHVPSALEGVRVEREQVEVVGRPR